MAERTSKSESAPKDLGADEHPAEGNLPATSDKRVFSRTGKALAEFWQAFLKLCRVSGLTWLPPFIQRSPG